MKEEHREAYHAAHESAAYYVFPDGGSLSIHGEDRVDFLQRQSTNDLSMIVPGTTVATILLSPTARIIDFLHLYRAGQEHQPGTELSESLVAITLPGRHEETAQFLQGRIFFMDNVKVIDDSRSYTHINLIGPDSSRVLVENGIKLPDEPGKISSTEFHGGEMRIIQMDGLLYSGYYVLAPMDLARSIESMLGQARIRRLPPDVYRLIQIESGLPSAAGELTEKYTPLELGLGKAISDNKGCYTGQEIIARQLTYDKITRSLVGLNLYSPASQGDRLYFDGKPAGEITSASESPRFGNIALAVVRRPYNEEKVILQVRSRGDKGDEESEMPAIVTRLPF